MSKFYGPDKPIKTKKEWEESFEQQAKTVSDTLNITMDQARVRLHALFVSGLLENFNPEDKLSQFMVDAFMTNPAWDKQPKSFGENKNNQTQ